nr:uncharacterized protein LOC111414629 isoform X2 [Onthophagus taurus]
MSLKIFVLWFFLKILFFSSTTSCWPVTETKITSVVGSRRDDIERDSMTRDDGVGKNEVDVNKPPTEDQSAPITRDFESYFMMGDQPMNDDGFKTISVAPLDDDGASKVVVKNFGDSSTIDPILLKRIRTDRMNRITDIKVMVPIMTGRVNLTETSNKNNSSKTYDDIINSLPPIEKVIPFLPKCSAPKIAKDNWKDDNLLYLFFNVSYGVNATLASAVIKLHRIASENLNLNLNLNNQGEGEKAEEKLLRVSIYWFSKQGKKQKVKKLLCDSAVIPEKQATVELNVKPALISWLETQNLGFGVKVENQEEVTYKANNFYKGADCKTNAGQHFPSLDHLLNNTSNEFHVNTLENILSSMGHSPIINICTVESITGAPLSEKFVRCQLHKTIHNQTNQCESNHRKVQNVIGTEHHHKIRHQKHNIERHPVDIRSYMENETIYLTKDELDLYSRGKPK